MLVGDGVPEDRTVTVHEGIELEHVLAVPAVNVHEAFFLPHHAPVVGNIAALVPHKGQRHLIEAAHLVVREVPDARFIILGEGELREQLERQVRDYHLEKHVLLPGFRTDVLGCLKAFDIFAMSSVTEGPSARRHVARDAMACSEADRGVATTAGGIPRRRWTMSVTGLLTPRARRLHHAMAASIVRLLKNDEELPKRMGEAGFCGFNERSSTLERMVAGTSADTTTDVAGTPRTQRALENPASARVLKPHARSSSSPGGTALKSWYLTGSAGSISPERRRVISRAIASSRGSSAA